MTELRSTVALLRAMPRADVPRSFTLPTAIGLPPVQPARVNTEPPRRQRVLNYTLRRTVRVVSTLAAVLGFLFILSGLLANLQFPGGGGTTAAPALQSVNPQASQATKTGPSAVGSNDRGTPKVGKVTEPATKTPAAAQLTPTLTATPANNTVSPPPANQAPTIPPALDPSRPEGRLSLGLLLLLFSIIGLLTTRRRRSVVHQ